MADQKKKILIFSFVYYPRFIGGAEIAIKEITDRVEGVEFDLIALRLDKSLPETEKIGNVTVHRIGWTGSAQASPDSLPAFLHLNKYAYPFLAAIKACKLHAHRKYTAIWGMMANYSGFAALFFKLFHMDVPFLLTLQEGDPIEYIKSRAFRISIGPIKIPVKWIMLPVFGMIFKHADRIQTISNYLADFAKSMGATCPVTVVPNGVDVPHFSQEYSPDEIGAIKTSLGKAEGDVFIITTSRLVVKNAVNDIVEALSHLPANVKLIVLGVGYELANLKALAAELDVASRVQFLGYVSHADMPKYLKASDIFIRPSISEGFGNSFIEAMAAGLPVIATPVGGIVDFLKNKETGLFCEVSNPEDIARKVEVYMHDTGLRDEIVDNAMHMVLDHYDWKLVSKDMREKVFDIL
ncbi:MAG TPA: glycosyltransferase family 4 protein [Candidatus Paceibacterota bacterium]